MPVVTMAGLGLVDGILGLPLGVVTHRVVIPMTEHRAGADGSGYRRAGGGDTGACGGSADHRPGPAPRTRASARSSAAGRAAKSATKGCRGTTLHRGGQTTVGLLRRQGQADCPVRQRVKIIRDASGQGADEYTHEYSRERHCLSDHGRDRYSDATLPLSPVNMFELTMIALARCSPENHAIRHDKTPSCQLLTNRPKS